MGQRVIRQMSPCSGPADEFDAVQILDLAGGLLHDLMVHCDKIFWVEMKLLKPQKNLVHPDANFIFQKAEVHFVERRAIGHENTALPQMAILEDF